MHTVFRFGREPTLLSNLILYFFIQSRERKTVRIQADDPISFLQLLSKNEFGGGENMFDVTMSQALGIGANKKGDDPLSSSKLNKV